VRTSDSFRDGESASHESFADLRVVVVGGRRGVQKGRLQVHATAVPAPVNVGERRFSQRRRGLGQPLCQIDGKANSPPCVEQQRLPGRDGRKPQLISGVAEFFSDSGI
jgi:hypothetical protein